MTKKFGKCKLVILNDVFVDIAVVDLKVPSIYPTAQNGLCISPNYLKYILEDVLPKLFVQMHNPSCTRLYNKRTK